jgi:hypothetical protein
MSSTISRFSVTSENQDMFDNWTSLAQPKAMLAPSNLLSSLLDKLKFTMPVIRVVPETTALTREQQRTYMRALRRSVQVVS